MFSVKWPAYKNYGIVFQKKKKLYIYIYIYIYILNPRFYDYIIRNLQAIFTANWVNNFLHSKGWKAYEQHNDCITCNTRTNSNLKLNLYLDSHAVHLSSFPVGSIKSDAHHRWQNRPCPQYFCAHCILFRQSGCHTDLQRTLWICMYHSAKYSLII